ncbi:MAG: hypothetical protein WB523_09180, partial [Candidatus Sulfotelmatobacter sp.]
LTRSSLLTVSYIVLLRHSSSQRVTQSISVSILGSVSRLERYGEGKMGKTGLLAYETDVP